MNALFDTGSACRGQGATVEVVDRAGTSGEWGARAEERAADKANFTAILRPRRMCLRHVAVILLLPLVMLTARLQAQLMVTSTIAGEVQDTQHYVIPAAVVTLVEQQTLVSHTVKTNAEGQFRFSELQPGTYTVTVTEAGFETYKQTGIVLTSTQTVNLPPFALLLGKSTETVTVHSDTNAIDTTTTNVTHTLGGEELSEISTRSGDVMELLAFLPGIVNSNPDGLDAPARNSVGSLTINGVGAGGNGVTVLQDGVNAAAQGNPGYQTVVPSIEMVKEIKISSSNYRADSGSQGGATISIITKTGERKYHGSVEFPFRSELFNANKPDNKKNYPLIVRPTYALLLPGASFSGPLLIPHLITTRADLFFFVGIQYQHTVGSTSLQYDTLPTAAQRTGDFSNTVDSNGSKVNIIDPALPLYSAANNSNPCGYVQTGSRSITTNPVLGGTNTYSPIISRDGTGATCNMIPENRIEPNGQKALNLFPLPNFISGSGCTGGISPCGANYQYSVQGVQDRTTYSANLDWNPQQRPYSMSAHYLYGPYRETSNGPGGILGNNSVDLGQFANVGINRNVSLTLRNTFSQTLVNSLQFGFNLSFANVGPVDPSIESIATTGINPPSLYPGADTSGFIPDFSFGGGGLSNTPTISLDSGNRNPSRNGSLQINTTDNLSKVFARHVITAGASLSLTIMNASTGLNARGKYDYSGNSSNIYDTNNPFSNALLGSLSAFSQAPSRPRGYLRARSFESFIQDEWRVRGNLSLSIGGRFIMNPDPYEKENKIYGFVPSFYSQAAAPVLLRPQCVLATATGCTGTVLAVNPLNANQTFNSAFVGFFAPGYGDTSDGVVHGGSNGISRSILTHAPLLVSPRAGFAYTPFANNKTVIRGGGGIYYTTSNIGNLFSSTGLPPNHGTVQLNYTNIANIAAASGTAMLAPSVSNLLPVILQPPQTSYNFSLGVTHEFGKMFVAAVNYVGAESRHFQQSRNISPIPIGSRFLPQNADPRNPSKALPDSYFSKYLGFANINQTFNTGTSNYHSIQTNFREDLRKYHLTLNEYYTFAKSMGTQGKSAYYPAPYSYYGPSGGHRPHVATLNFVYYMPKPGAALHIRALAAVTDGWELSGLVSWGSAQYLTPGYSVSNNPLGSGSTDSSRLEVVNPAAPLGQGRYGAPENGGFGDASVNTEKGISYVTDSVSVIRNFVVKERFRMSAQIDAYNPTNSQLTNGIDQNLSFIQPGSTYNVDPNSFTTNELSSSHQNGRILQFNFRARF